MKVVICSIVILSFFMGSSCEKIKYYPDINYAETNTKIIAHRAGGFNSKFGPYTVEAADFSLQYVDGIEVDLQISKDRTIWLSHDAELPVCNNIDYKCFPESTDSEIIQLDACDGNENTFTRLEDIFSLLSQKYPGKYISLDVKAWVPCAVASSDILAIMNVIADEIIRLTKKYNLQDFVMVESETATFLNYIKHRSSGIECYITSLGDFERAMQLALESGYAGISFKYKFKEEISDGDIQLIRHKGLKIQLWTVNSEDNLKEAISINPDFIQTDNINYFIP